VADTNVDRGVYLEKEAVRAVLESLEQGKQSIEQATNAIGRLARPPRSAYELALTVGCPYCGFTPGNRCRRTAEVMGERAWVPIDKPHPSRLADAFTKEPLR